MSEDELVEAVALAICEAHGMRVWKHLTFEGQVSYRGMARAAIEAMRKGGTEAPGPVEQCGHQWWANHSIGAYTCVRCGAESHKLA
jgi:hypothetical protein